MRFPLMLRSTHMREHVEQAEAYRWQIDSADRGRKRAEAKLTEWVRQCHDAPSVERDFRNDTRIVYVKVAEQILRRLHSDSELAQHLSRSIVNVLFRVNEDLRGDGREDPRARLLR